MERRKKLKRKPELKSTKAITLVALVVTIVVLLILAGVSLNLILGNNGIIAKAKDAKNATEKDAENTDKGLSELADEMYEALGEDVPLGQVTVGTKAGKNSTINGEAATATNPVIPKGYIAIDTETSKWGNGTTSPTETDVNKGLVITDSVDASGVSNGNEWVWVPVPDASIMYETSETPLPLRNSPSLIKEGEGGSGGMADPMASLMSGANIKLASSSMRLGMLGAISLLPEDVTTRKYSKEIISGIKRGKPGGLVAAEDDASGLDIVYDEPDLVPTDNDSKAQAAGFTDLLDMAKNIVKDYEEMIASIEKYKGFYIGRYELSDAGEKRGQLPSVDDYYKIYAKCKGLAANSKVETRMIWGCQWDVTCKWLIDSGGKTSGEVLTSSSSWGNYNDSTGEATGGNYVKGEIKETGSNEAWKANNIYDLAGNCDEYTQEMHVPRGGYFLDNGAEKPASYRFEPAMGDEMVDMGRGIGGTNPGQIGVGARFSGSRPTLTIK